jgi:HK97 family phage portal protein
VGKYRQGGEIVQLGLLLPDRVRPEIKAGRPRYEVTDYRGNKTMHGVEDIVHIKALTTDGLVGLSPIRQARIVLGLSGQLAEHSSVFFANDARPSGVLKLKRFAGSDSEDVDKLKESFNAEHKGGENAHKIAVLAGEAEFVPFSMPLDDAQFLEQRKLSAVEVARIFRVPPWMIGADPGQSMTYSNTEQQALQFVTYSLRPWLVCIEQAFSNDPDLFGPREYVEFLLDALLRADSKTRAEFYKLALDPITGWMNRDEVRQRENLEPEPAQPGVPPGITAVPTENGNGAGVT